jgi:hypothetical protein
VQRNEAPLLMTPNIHFQFLGEDVERELFADPYWIDCYYRRVLPFEQLLDASFTVAAMDSSVTYLRNFKKVLPHIASHFPWTKLMVYLREPLASIASTVHQARAKYNNGAYTFAEEFSKFKTRYAFGAALLTLKGTPCSMQGN